ncbi:membrane protein [Bacteroidia bacterium]|nr:membrane protein [Bacteroidia bacterium]
MKRFFAAAALSVVILAGCNTKSGNKSDLPQADSAAVRVASERIAYVNLDSLTASYDMYHDLRAAYEKKVTRTQNDVNSRGRNLEKEIADFQEKIDKGLVTRSTAAQMQESLGNKQQNFMQFRERAMGELAEEEQVLLNQIHYSIVEFLKEYNSDYRYAAIMSTTAAGPILNADPLLDITKEVVAGLNKRYAANKAAEPKETGGKK